MELKLSQSSVPTTSRPTTTIFKSSEFFHRNFTLLARRWKLQFEQISWKGRNLTKKISVHVVKEGETLSSISKLYGVPILDIVAANKDIMDVDLVFRGQCLNIQSPVVGYVEVCHFKDSNELSKATKGLGYYGRQWNQIISTPSTHHLLVAKRTGSFLLVVLLVAFCMRYVMLSFLNRVSRAQKVRKSGGIYNLGSKGVRWKSALSDIRDPDGIDPQSEYESVSDHLSEDHDEFHIKDRSDAYGQLEDDYQKFLSECGMSKWGYWRGGSPK